MQKEAWSQNWKVQSQEEAWDQRWVTLSQEEAGGGEADKVFGHV